MLWQCLSNILNNVWHCQLSSFALVLPASTKAKNRWTNACDLVCLKLFWLCISVHGIMSRYDGSHGRPPELFPPSCVVGVAACVSDRPPYRHHFSTDCPTTSIGKTKRTQATIQIFVNKCENFHLMETCSTSWVDKLYFKQTHHPTKVRRRTKSAGLYRRRKKPQDWYEYWVYGPKQAFFIPQQHVSVKIWNLSWI